MSSVTLPTNSECARTWLDDPSPEAVVLQDGRRANLRPMQSSDVAALRQFFFGCLSFQARLMRFHCGINHLPESALIAMTAQVPGRQVALAALTTTDDGAPRMLAEARFIVQDNAEAEFAIAVADAWQGQGLGRALLQRLIGHARAKGISTLNGAAIPSNDSLLRLMAGLGAEMWADGPEVSIRLSI